MSIVRTLGLILAGGRALRFGADKTLAMFGGAFFNINQPEDLATAERWLAEREA